MNIILRLFRVTVLPSLVLFVQIQSSTSDSYHQIPDDYYKDKESEPGSGSPAHDYATKESALWLESNQDTLANLLYSSHPIEQRAKNVILMIGDGMSIPTVTATRIFKAGEASKLFFETFPNVGLLHTFCANAQTADSACSSTSFLCGTKGNIATLGVKADVTLGDCSAGQNRYNQVESILAWAQAEGKATGVVTNTRITHATPAGSYAHTANRDWECDANVTASGLDSSDCDDIAEQLIYGAVGRKLNVIFGGGRSYFLPEDVLDPETNTPGARLDGKNLLETWKEYKKHSKAAYIWNRYQLLHLNPYKTDYVLGLFGPDHLPYVLDSTTAPSVAEMTSTAISVLKKNPKGFVLLVEGGRIDMAHHTNNAQKAFAETIWFDNAVAVAAAETSDYDTLLLVSADHSHVMTMSGYPKRGNPILAFGGTSDVDGKPYTTISYANGPGYKSPGTDGQRYDLTNDPLDDKEYAQMTGLPLVLETHGGDDVAVYARGPFAHLLTGVQDQSFLPHVIGFAACMGPGLRYCNSYESSESTNYTASAYEDHQTPVVY